MKRLTKSVKQYFKENLGILIGFFTLCVIVALLNNRFLSRGNILNVLRQLFSNCNLALGMCLVIITGGIDLSVGAIMALSGTLCAGTIAAGQLPIPVAILMGLAIGVLVGFINGTITAKMNIAPFIVTMATQQICRGLVYVYADGLPIRCDNPPFNFLGNGYIGEIPITILYSIFFVIVIWLVLSKSQLGRWIYAVGGNKNAARFSGINVDKVLMIVYSISGFLAAFAGIIYCARMYSGQPTLGNGDETDAIAAVVLGGTSFSGGIGKIGGVVIGILIIAVLSNALNLLGINSFWQLVAKGVVILLAVCVDNIKTHKRVKG
ncbi:MAG: ribose ABC transporter permease [Oscillospiraceae bacterium]|jgi:ribose transport system permease protein|nr:ribose ABC transporter permease [Oscillospiraceae bacterium]